MGEASWFYFADEDPSAFPQFKFIGKAWCKILHIEPELDFGACLGKRGDDGVIPTFNECDVQHETLLIADDLDWLGEWIS